MLKDNIFAFSNDSEHAIPYFPLAREENPFKVDTFHPPLLSQIKYCIILFQLYLF